MTTLSDAVLAGYGHATEPNRYVEKTKGPAIARQALGGVGRPCRDRTYDQRIKSRKHTAGACA